MPQRTRAYTGLAQVTAPSDKLTARQNRRPCNAICPARSTRAMLAEAPPGAPRALGKWLNPMDRLATASAIGALKQPIFTMVGTNPNDCREVMLLT